MPDPIPNTSLNPDFSSPDRRRHWAYIGPIGTNALAGRQAVYVSPHATIVAMQRAVGATADGVWGDGTSQRLIAFLQSRGAPAAMIADVERAWANRQMNYGAWLAAIAIAKNISLANAKNEIVIGNDPGSVTLPRYGARSIDAAAPSAPSTPAPRPATPPPAPSTPSAPGVSMSVAQRMSAFYTAYKTPINVLAVVAGVAAIGGIAYMMMRPEEGGDMGPTMDEMEGPRGLPMGGMDAEDAARLLGIRRDSDPSSIRAAYARQVRGYPAGDPDAAERRAEMRAARDALLAYAGA